MRLRNFLPKSILARSILLFLVPCLLLFIGLNWFYFENHISEVNRKLAQSVGRDIAVVLKTCDSDSPAPDFEEFQMEHRCGSDSVALLPDNHRESYAYRKTIEPELEGLIEQPVRTYLLPATSQLAIIVGDAGAESGTFLIDKKRILVANAHFLMVWGGIFLLLLIAIVLGFMRQQVRSIIHLSEAAEAFGRGQDNFELRQSGATEVRSAARSLKQMRDRLKSFVEQRTSMLAGISHDLRTPLTRLKLTLAMMQQTDDVVAARNDLDDMRRMLDEYLEFARQDHQTDHADFDLVKLIETMEITKSPKVTLQSKTDSLIFSGRAALMKRAVENLVSNALKYGTQVQISIAPSPRNVRIVIDDDGPGIPDELKEQVFAPFFRVDTARNQNISGSGLGLTIARDAVSTHGGNLHLDESPMGGLRATIVLPV